MRKRFLIMLAFVATTALWAQNNVITYTANAKLPETTEEYSSGLRTNAFNVAISSHIFASGKGTITFTGDVTQIGKCAFYKCTGLKSITIPNSVITIGNWAFFNCSVLKKITIPKSVTAIEDYAFSDCSALTSIRVEQGNPNYDSRNDCNAIIETATNTLLCGCKNTIIPNTVTTIGTYAFAECQLLSITIPSSVTRIGVDAFFRCGLTELTLPGSVQEIGGQAFGGNLLTKIICLASTPPFIFTGDVDTFYGVDKAIPVYVPAGSISAYQSAYGWRNFTNYIAYVPKTYALYVAGIQVNELNCGDILGDGTVSYDPDSKTLTLDNANISCSTKSPIFNTIFDLTIDCKGNNTLTYAGSAEGEHGLYANRRTTITTTQANSSLTINSPNAAVRTSEVTTIVDGNNFQLHLILNGAQYGFLNMGSQEFSSNLVIKDAHVDIAATSENAIFHANSLTVDGADLIAKGNGNYATISCDELIMQNGVSIRSAHTYDAATHKFLTTAGNEAKDDIIIGVEGTGLEQLTIDNAQGTIRKMIIDNRLLIRHNGNLYHTLGGKVR